MSLSERAEGGAAALSVPFLDLSRVQEDVKAPILEEIAKVIDTSAFTNGPQVAAFEEAFARYCRVRHCVGVASGLDGLRLALIASGLEAGDEVIIPANTFIATFEAVTQAGGKPVPADASERDYNLDVAAAAAAVSSRARFLLPVHLYGQMADMHALARVAARYNLQVIEDACQAQGAERDGVRSGAAGRAAAFSFYPAKNLGAMGDAGAVTTDDDDLALRVAALREHGQRAKYIHDEAGYTARLDTIQALVLLHKLPLLDEWNEARREAAEFYMTALAGVGDLVLPPIPGGSGPVWHLFVVRTKRSNDLTKFLASRQIGTARHYPQPPHLSHAYADLRHRRGSFPVTEALADEGISLPIFPGISEAELDSVVAAIVAFFRGG